MEMEVKARERQLEIHLRGELDHHGAKGLMRRIDREIEAALPIQLVLHMGEVSFMDSSGIAVIMRARERMRELGGSIRLAQTPLQVKKVLEAAKVTRFVEMV